MKIHWLGLKLLERTLVTYVHKQLHFQKYVPIHDETCKNKTNIILFKIVLTKYEQFYIT